MESNSGIKPWQWGVSIAIIIILVGLGFYMWKGSSTTVTPDDTTGANTGNSISTTTNAVTVNSITITDQFPGNIVYASSVRLSDNGFIVIHKDNSGTPGDIIGSQYLAKGINPAKITLTADTTDGKTYHAMLHKDDGDKKFDATKDLPIKDSSGKTVMKAFKVTSEPVEDKG